jgi:hypothetical protein
MTSAFASCALLLAASVTTPIKAQTQAKPRNLQAGYSVYLHNLPARPAQAITGSEFLKRTMGMNPDLREEYIYREVVRGNIPDRLRYLRPITINGQIRGNSVRLVVYVLPDYMAIGSNEDNVLMPMNFFTAARIAKKFGFTLPTTKLVDEIYRQSELKLEPVNLKPGANMGTNYYYGAHAQIVANLEKAKGFAPNSSSPVLIAGHKKDLVLSRKLVRKPTSIAIYGWHDINGQPIQPVSTAHAATYADYSHGARFVAETVYVNGQPTSLYAVLADPNYAPLISNEGNLKNLSQFINYYAVTPMGTYSYRN